MADLNDIAIFVKVARYESFSAAARSLGMPVSTVSRRVAGLEEELGVTLLQRTTRKLSLTAQGLEYFRQCSGPLDELSDAERVLTSSQKEAQGSLRITVPVALREAPFLEFVSDFLARHPRIDVDLSVTNDYVDFVAQNIDMGIRFGFLDDSSLIARKLGSHVRYLVAAPSYLAQHPVPEKPEDLAGHRCVLMNGKHGQVRWDLVNGRKRLSLQVSGPVTTHDFHSAAHFTQRGHGIGLLPFSYCDEQVRRGKLVRVLPKWSSQQIPVHALYPTRRFMPAKLRLFLDALYQWQSPFWF